MTATETIQRLHQHRMWVNHRLWEAVGGLSEEQLQQALPIGQGSVWRTLTHLYAAEYVWLEAMLGDERPLAPGDAPGKLPGNQEGEGAAQSLAELIARWEELDGRWKAFLEGLTDASLDGVIYKVSTSSAAGQRHAVKLSDCLLHVCTHAQYTTAQLVNMLRQLGRRELPDVMLITLARQEAAAGTGGE